MAEKPFRVLLDLTELHIESFKYVWICVSPRELKTIADFKQSLLQKVNLGSVNIKLFVRDGLLLDEETIIVLREDDTVKVQYEKEFIIQETSNSSSKSKCSRKRNFIEYSEENRTSEKKTDNASFTAQGEVYDEELTHKTRKKHKKSHRLSHEENVYLNSKDCSKSVCEKQKKNKDKSLSTEVNSLDLNSQDNCVSFPTLQSQHNISEKYREEDKHAKNNKNKTVGSVTFETIDKALQLNKISFNTSEVESDMHGQLNISTTESTNNCPKKKRKRHRKRKKSDILNEVISNISADNKSFLTEIPSECPKRKHVIFTSNSPEKSEKKPETMNLDSYSSDNHTTYNIYTADVPMADQKNHRMLYPKISTPTQSNGCDNPNWQVSLMQSDNLDSACDDTQSVKKHSIKNNEHININTQQNAKNNSDLKSGGDENCPDRLPYAMLPSLNAVPSIGAHIVYKILELNENYSPEVSEYREGIVRTIDPETDEMEIELVKHEIKPGRTGKFENLKIDEVPPPEIKKTDTVCWSALIEPKLISH